MEIVHILVVLVVIWVDRFPKEIKLKTNVFSGNVEVSYNENDFKN